MADHHEGESHEDEKIVQRATVLTAQSIRQLVDEYADEGNTSVSMLSFTEREDLIQEIGRVIPAGNVVNFVFSGILNARERERTAPADPQQGRSHLNAIFKGLSVLRENLVYQLAFTGPATVLAGYNMLLQLAGKDPEQFLPDGAWQFFVEFGLREDAAHHQTETIGFERELAQFEVPISDVDRLSAWIMASMQLIKNYETLLELIWEENVRLQIIEETTGLTGLHRAWATECPYSAPDIMTDIVAHRAKQFEAFCNFYLSQVSQEQWRTFSQKWYQPAYQEERGRIRRDYVRQLTIFRHLEPGEYGDERYPIVPSAIHIGIIYRGNYYLLNVTDPTSPQSQERIHAQATAILNSTAPSQAEVDSILTTLPRSAQVRSRAALDDETRSDLERLRKAVILINWDQTSRDQPLSFIRMGKRGIGDHALTVFRTDQSTVFDFSHIFFDGPWAMAVAEILTNEARKYLHVLHAKRSAASHQLQAKPLKLPSTPRFHQVTSRYPQTINYISAESTFPIEPMQTFRVRLKERTRIRLTINDLLVLYRTIYNFDYQPSEEINKQLAMLRREARGALLARNIENMFQTLPNTNPSLLIPIDASRYSPKERIFPSTFRSPLPDFHAEHHNLLKLYQQANQRRAPFGGKRNMDIFEQERRKYLAYLKAFGELMMRYRDIATSGESMSMTAIRLIAGLPGAMQQLANEIPEHLSFVNEAIKGEEVFSNVGRVTQGSSITRFSSAKDDNQKKVLVWGVMTDDHDMLYITLRDFRPPILDLVRAGHPDVAQHITYDFLEQYVANLHRFIEQIDHFVTPKHKR